MGYLIFKRSYEQFSTFSFVVNQQYVSFMHIL